MSLTVAAPSAARSRWQRMAAPTATVSTLAATTLALHYRDPHVSGSWGFCPSAALGFYCPGCGGLRAVNDLTNGDLAAAASSNLLFVSLLPFICLGLAWWSIDRWRGVEREPNASLITRATVAFAVVAVCFAVLRNVSLGAWLAP